MFDFHKRYFQLAEIFHSTEQIPKRHSLLNIALLCIWYTSYLNDEVEKRLNVYTGNLIKCLK